jgi:hypothetical protein
MLGAWSNALESIQGEAIPVCIIISLLVGAESLMLAAHSLTTSRVMIESTKLSLKTWTRTRLPSKIL